MIGANYKKKVKRNFLSFVSSLSNGILDHKPVPLFAILS